MSTATFDCRDPTFRAGPYPTLAMLRQYMPVLQAPQGFWLITRYVDVNALNRDPCLGRDLRKWAGYEGLRPFLADSPLERCVEQWMFSLDAPDHTRLRRLFARAFTPRIVNAMSDQIADIANDLLAELEGDIFDRTAGGDSWGGINEDIEVCGQIIPADSLLFCMLGAANHDPDVFTDPDTLDIVRDPNPHVSFGGGPHYCLGAPLARLEAQIALNKILQRWPTIELDESQVIWRDFINIRGLEKLPISVMHT